LSHGPHRELPAVAGGIEEKIKTSVRKQKMYFVAGMFPVTGIVEY